MELVNEISKWTGIITISIFLLFSFIVGVKNLYYLLMLPEKYIRNNHGTILDDVIDCHFKGEVKQVIGSSIKETLKETGVYRKIDAQKSIYMILTKKYLESEIKSNFKDYKYRLLKIIKVNSIKVEAKIGKNTMSTYSYYVNLRRIIPNSYEATQLSYILSGFIYKIIEDKEKSYDYIAVNRNSNAILGYLISNFLSIPLLIVNYDIRWELDGKEVNVDGLQSSTNAVKKSVFLVDDAVSDGTILKESCNILKDNGLNVSDVFVLFSRKEDDAKKYFKVNGLNLYSIFNIDDSDIKEIIECCDSSLKSLSKKL